MTIVAGSAVGILGLEGWGGFAVYLINQLLVRAYVFEGRSKHTCKAQCNHVFQSHVSMGPLSPWLNSADRASLCGAGGACKSSSTCPAAW
jgi:hypothetical protein